VKSLPGPDRLTLTLLRITILREIMFNELTIKNNKLNNNLTHTNKNIIKSAWYEISYQNNNIISPNRKSLHVDMSNNSDTYDIHRLFTTRVLQPLLVSTISGLSIRHHSGGPLSSTLSLTPNSGEYPKMARTPCHYM